MHAMRAYWHTHINRPILICIANTIFLKDYFGWGGVGALEKKRGGGVLEK